MIKRRARQHQIFSMSFLDVITCGFGALLMMLIIAKPGAPPADTGAIAALLKQSFQSEERLKELTTRLEELQQELAARRAQNAEARETQQTAQQQLQAMQQNAAQVTDELRGLRRMRQALERAAQKAGSATKRDAEVGGIPVGSDYVIFIIDTSGSMRGIWDRVIREIQNILDIHPEVKGFQVLDSDGIHLKPAPHEEWISDTPEHRKEVSGLLRNWKNSSSSSPVGGLKTALDLYAKPGAAISVYIFGDDYIGTGASFEEVLRNIAQLNTNPTNGELLAKVHAVGFLSQAASSDSDFPFPILMREVTRQNGGTFIALPR